MPAHLILKSSAYWIYHFFCYALSIIIGGGILGAILFPLVGLAFRLDYPFFTLVKNGFHDMAFLFMVWAPATAIVICVMKAHRSAGRYHQQD